MIKILVEKFAKTQDLVCPDSLGDIGCLDRLMACHAACQSIDSSLIKDDEAELGAMSQEALQLSDQWSRVT
jgi:uncharacterized protein with von Willebrand factor type A (vWA) domain